MASYERVDEIAAAGLTLTVTTSRVAGSGEICVHFARTSSCGDALMLHWGIVVLPGDDRSVYVRPGGALLPRGFDTDRMPGEPSMQTMFKEGVLGMRFAEKDAPAGIVFLVVEGGRWVKGEGGRSFFVALDAAISAGERQRRAEAEVEEEKKRVEAERVAEKKRAAEEKERVRLAQAEKELKSAREEEKDTFLERYAKAGRLFAEVDEVYEFGGVYVRAVLPAEDVGSMVSEKGEEEDALPAKLVVASTMALGGVDVFLHCGVKKGGRGTGWAAPALEECPEGTVAFDDKAVRVKLEKCGESGLRVAVFDNFPRGVVGFFAVVHVPDAEPHLHWIKSARNGGDIFVPLTPTAPLKGLPKGYQISGSTTGVIENIIEREMEYGSWTLMHRYSYGKHVVSEIGDDVHGWAAVYVWLRYSQIRVLDWSRNYNTKPRELSAAQLSLVTCLANRFAKMPDVRWLARQTMSCVGRGGSGDLGQRIRDDILVILRHNRGWGHGSMMEQWLVLLSPSMLHMSN